MDKMNKKQRSIKAIICITTGLLLIIAVKYSQSANAAVSDWEGFDNGTTTNKNIGWKNSYIYMHFGKYSPVTRKNKKYAGVKLSTSMEHGADQTNGSVVHRQLLDGEQGTDTSVSYKNKGDSIIMSSSNTNYVKQYSSGTWKNDNSTHKTNLAGGDAHDWNPYRRFDMKILFPKGYILQNTITGKPDSVDFGLTLYTQGSTAASRTLLKNSSLKGPYDSDTWVNAKLAASTVATGHRTPYGTTGRIRESINLVFYPNETTVKYNANGGTAAMNSQTIVYDNTELGAIEGRASRVGFVFKGWATSQSRADSGTVDYDYMENAAYDWPTEKSVTLYAVWQENTANISYYNSGKNDLTLPSPNPQAMTYTKQYKTAGATAPSGFSFKGWATTEDRAQKGIKDHDAYAVYKAENTTPSAAGLYAVVTSSLTYNSNGHGSAPDPVTMTYAGRIFAESMTNPAGYRFKGWAISQSRANAGMVDYRSGETVKNSSVWKENTTLWAVWSSGHTVTVKYNANGGSASGLYTADPSSGIIKRNGYDVTEEIDTEESYHDLYYNVSALGLTKRGYHTDKTDAWRNQTGTVLYNEDQVTAGGVNPVTAVTLNGGAELTSDKTVTIYANWKKNIYKVVFNPNGGSGNMPAQNFEYGESKALTANGFTPPSKDGGKWVFYGWATSEAAAASGEVNYYEDTVYSNIFSDVAAENNGTVNLYAVWRRKVDFVSGADGNSIRSAFQFYGRTSAGSSYQAQPVKVPGNSGTISGFTLSGWRPDTSAISASYDEAGSISPSDGSASTGTYTLYAVYTRPLYLKYDGNGASGGSTPDSPPEIQYYNSGSDSVSSVVFKLAENGFINPGVSFLSWDAGRPGSSYTWSPDRTAVETSRTVKAIWDVPACTITFHPCEGTFGCESVTVVRGSTDNNQPGIAIRRDYIFKGWYSQPAGGELVFDDDGNYVAGTFWTGSGEWCGSGDIDVYARWEETKGYRVMFAVGKSSSADPPGGSTSAGGSEIGDPANIMGEGYQYELLKDLVPDGIPGTEKSLRTGYKYHTRSLAFQPGGAVMGYHFTDLQGGISY